MLITYNYTYPGRNINDKHLPLPTDNSFNNFMHAKLKIVLYISTRPENTKLISHVKHLFFLPISAST